MDYIWEPIVGGILGFSYHPNITFFDNPSTILSNRSSYPQGFATPGIVSAITANSGSPYFDFQGNQVAWYVQDDWRVSRKLTLNLGVRHDVDLGLLGVSRQDRNRTYLILKHINSPWASHLPEDSLHDFAPRFGFAFDPKGEGKTVIRGGYGIYYDQTFINIPLFAQQQTYDTVFAQTTSLVNDVIGRGDLATFRVGDPINLAPASTTIAVGSQGRLIDQNYRSPMAQQSNIGFSQQFLKDFVLEVDYTQTLNTNESRRIRANPKIVVGSANPRLLESAFTAAGLPANRLADIIVDSSVNRSRYDGLNIGVRKRLSRRMSFQSSYTLSKAVGYGGTSGEFGATARYDQFHYLDPRELAPTIRDERHRLTFSGVIDLPGGLQISPILQFATPRPYTLNAGTDVNRDGVNPSGTGANIQGADVCTAGTAASNGRVCPQNSGIDTQRGGYDLDGNWQSGRFFLLDLRASKYFSLGRVREGMTIGLFFETFNLTNRVNFGNRFTPSVRSSSFMTTAGLATMTYGITAASPFQAQAGFRFSF